MARLFGAGAVFDAFLLGFRIPNLARDLVAEGALSSAFVPVFARALSREGRAAAAALAGRVATALTVAVGLLCAAGMAASPLLVSALAPGFAEVPGKFELAVKLTRIMFPFLLLVTLSAQAMGVLNALNRFGVPALASVWFNVVSVASGLWLGYGLGPRLGLGLIESMSWGVVLGGAAQLLWQAPSLVRAGFVWRPRLDWSHPDLRRILMLMGPALLGNAAVQINFMVNLNLASSLTDAAGRVIDGPVSWLGYAFRFLQLPIGLFGVAIASATLPAVARSAAAGRMEEFRAQVSHSLALVCLLTVPSSVGLAVLGRSVVGAVYQAGRFEASDTRATAAALAAYAVGLAGYAAIKILAPAFYALGDSRSPMLVSVFSIAVNFAAAVGLVKLAGWGHAGLALATSLVALIGAAALFALLRARLGRLGGRGLASTAARVGAASAVMGAVCLVSSHAVHQWLGMSRAAHVADVAISVPLGVAVFWAAARALRVRELSTVLDF